MVHAGADNFANIPDRYGEPDQTTLNTGDAGGRAACGVVR
jgi:Cu-Zn family superoxide dismutase